MLIFKKYILTIVLLCLFVVTKAQDTLFIKYENESVIGAFVTINDFTSVSNKNGEVIIPSKYNKGIITINHYLYETYIDTLALNNNITVKLNQNAIALDDVVITAQYTPKKIENSVNKVNIINKEKIEAMAAITLKDVLTNELNIRISEDNILGSGMSMQGISGENVKILIDGVPVIGRQNGNIDLSQINLNDIEKIEIIEGPLSVNYGSNALAGTINLITKKTSRYKYDIKYNNYLDNITTNNNTISAGYQSKFGRFSLGLGKNIFNGWNPTDNFLPNFESVSPDSSRHQLWKPKVQEFSRFNYHYKKTNYSIGYKTEYFTETITNRGYPRAPFGEIAFDDYYNTFRFDNAVDYTFKTGKNGAINGIIAYNHFKRIKNSYIANLASGQKVLSETIGAQDTSIFNLLLFRGTYSNAKDSSNFNYQIGYDINHETAVGQRITNKQRTITDYALFGSSEIVLLKKLTLKPGVRWAYNSAFKAPIIPSINTLFKQKIKSKSLLSLRASYAKGFRAPALKELYFVFVDINHNIVGNENLMPEQSDNFSFNGSYKTYWKKFTLNSEVSLFYNSIQNLITLAQNSEGTEFTYINIGNFETRGININQGIEQGKFKLNIGASYTGLYNQLSEKENIQSFSYYPEIRSNLMYTIPKINITTGVFYKYQGKLPGFFMDDEGAVSQSFINPFSMCDITLSKKIWKNRINLTSGVKNIFNVTNVNSQSGGTAHSAAGNATAIARGRILFISTVINFQK